MVYSLVEYPKSFVMMMIFIDFDLLQGMSIELGISILSAGNRRIVEVIHVLVVLFFQVISHLLFSRHFGSFNSISRNKWSMAKVLTVHRDF